jgi:hypothetical protein
VALAGGYLPDDPHRIAEKTTSAVGLVRIPDVDEMVRQGRHFFWRRFAVPMSIPR